MKCPSCGEDRVRRKRAENAAVGALAGAGLFGSVGSAVFPGSAFIAALVGGFFGGLLGFRTTVPA